MLNFPLSIRQKVLILFALVALMPLLLINLIWLRSSQTQLKNAADDRQRLLVSSSAERVNQFIDTKIDNAIIHSQIEAVRQIDIPQARLNLLEYSKQEGNLLTITLIDAQGQEQIKVEGTEFSPVLLNVKDSDAFKVVTFLGGKEYISPVQYNLSGQPFVKIGVPLISFTQRQTAEDLSTAEAGIRRGAGEIKGALIIELDLSNLWQTVLSERLGVNGYAYIVDDKGSLIAYPDLAFASSHQNLRHVAEVDAAIQTLTVEDLSQTAANFEPTPRFSISETGAEVLSSYFPIARTKWAVIGQEPISSVYADVNRASRIAWVFFAAATMLASVLIIFSSRRLTKPIDKLSQGALRLGKGELNHRIDVTSRDELGLLAQTFNQMATNLQALIEKYRLRNVELAAERAKLNTVLNTITDGILAITSDHRIALANQAVAKLIGRDVSWLTGQPWLDVFNLSHGLKPFSNDLLKENFMYFKDAQLTAGQEEKYLDITAIKLVNQSAGIDYILTIHDTTASRQLEIMRLDFVSMAAHELRTPLTAITGYLELLRDAANLTAQDKVNLKRATANSIILQNLIKNMLSLAKIERGALAIKIQLLDWNQLVKDEIANYQLVAKDRKLTIQYQPSPQPIKLEGDELSLREVLQNLISNSVHYTPAGGSITVKVELPQQGTVKTSVTDTGIGIPKAALPHLFTKYYRVRGGLTTDSAGTGIGLFICKTIIELHNGTIGVESTEGKGSTFSFTLPISKD